MNTPRKKVSGSMPRSRSFNIIDPLAVWINQKLEIDERLSPTTLRKTLWVMFLILIYIFFQHNFDGLIRRLNTTEKLVNEQRASFISFKSKYLFASKQSEIERKLAESGFEKSTTAPIKIMVKPE